MKEDLHDQEVDIGALSVDGDHFQVFRVFCKDKVGDSFPKVLVTNGRVAEGCLNFARHGTLGEYCKIWKICAYMFELYAGRLVQMHQLLDRMDIAVTNSILIVFKQE